MSEVTFRKWYLGDFGYGYHGCIDVDGEELYETFDENIAVKLYNFLKKRDNISLSDIKEFFHFLWIESEFYQCCYEDYIDMMKHFSTKRIKELEE